MPDEDLDVLPRDAAHPYVAHRVRMHHGAAKAVVSSRWSTGCGTMIRVPLHPLVAAKRDEIVALCRELGVLRLDVFGSAVTEDFDVRRSDVDVLVEFDTRLPGSIDVYLGLKDGLEQILGRPVDVVMTTAIRNPYLRAHAMETRERLFAA